MVWYASDRWLCLGEVIVDSEATVGGLYTPPSQSDQGSRVASACAFCAADAILPHVQRV